MLISPESTSFIQLSKMSQGKYTLNSITVEDDKENGTKNPAYTPDTNDKEEEPKVTIEPIHEEQRLLYDVHESPPVHLTLFFALQVCFH